MKRLIYLWVVLAAAMLFVSEVIAQGYDPTQQTTALWMDEANLMYQANLARRAQGLAPLRWNRQLTYAARWFTWDSIVNRSEGYCGHTDTNGDHPVDRVLDWGYLGSAGAEIAYCVYASPVDAIIGWLESPGHREILLDPNHREIGGGYYLNGSGRGYITIDFGVDPVYSPVIIDNEAPTTSSLNTSLYIHDRSGGGGFNGFAPAVDMQVSNDACFLGAQWEPFQAEKNWSLASGGNGWRTVYARTRDAMNRTTTSSDSIYYGSAIPETQRGDETLSSTSPSVTLYGLDGKGYPKVQFSLGWMADNTQDTFELLWGSGKQVQDGQAWGGSAYLMGPPGSAGETSTWVYTTDFIKNIPMVAYVRMKVADNTLSDEVARFSATGGGELHLKGTDFKAPNVYQEFPLEFTFPSSEQFLIFQFWRSGSTDVYVDGVSLFTASQSFGPITQWAVPGGNYRGQGVWVRYTDDAGHFTGYEEAVTQPAYFSASPDALLLIAGYQSRPASAAVKILEGCRKSVYQARSDQPWLAAAVTGNTVQVQASPEGLDYGMYLGSVTISAPANANMPPVTVPVILRVEDDRLRYFPSVAKPAKP